MNEIFSKVWEFSKNRHKSLVKALAFSFIRSALGVTQLFSVILAINVIVGKAEVRSSVVKIIILALICIIGNFVTSYVEQISTLETGFLMIGDKRVEIGNKLRKVPLGFFNQTSTGKITATLTTTLLGIETASTMVMIGIISGLFSSLTLFLFMMLYDWRIGILTGTGMVIYLIVVGWQIKVSRENAPMLQKAQSKLAESALTFLRGIKVTKAFSFSKGDERLKKTIQGSCDANINLTNISMPSQFAAHFIIALFESMILLLSLYLGFMVKDISIVKTIVLMVFSFIAYASLNQAGSMLSMIGLLDTGIREVEEIEKAEQLELEQPIETIRSEEIAFDNVSFSYGNHEVLKNISMVIKPRSLTAIVGPSGSGKTTLCQLIPRFRDVTSGKITIGGANICHVEYEELMKKISMVFQNVYLFEDTILNNIRFGKPEATLEEVRAAAKSARCDDFIMSLPNQYETMIEEGGSSLSGGEKQRISIARAILKDSPIIILDEATSALDAENEHEILAAIEELIKDKTVIMIAHRIQTVEKADHIIVISDGEVVQEGTHNKLCNESGIYANFVRVRKEASGWKIKN